MSTALRVTDHCPLCQCAEYNDESQPLANLYSEQLAALLSCAELDLLTALVNRRCYNCGLWYKAQWFRAELLVNLFRARVPVHPKGWDAHSDRFSEAGWAREIEDYAHAVDARDSGQIARFHRGLNSILDSIVDADAGQLTQRARMAVNNHDVSTLRKLLPEFDGRFVQAFPFRRFSGFSAKSLWNWLLAKLGPISNYAEIGCPLWGQLANKSEVSVRRWYFDRAEPNYWGSGCQKDQVHCVQSLCARAAVNRINWDDHISRKMDVLGAFQYLDHLQFPARFVDEAFARAKSLLLILDSVDQPPAVQHFTGWSESAIAWVGKAHGKRIVADFDAILASGNRAWLLSSD